jgi:hypothetical protein
MLDQELEEDDKSDNDSKFGFSVPEINPGSEAEAELHSVVAALGKVQCPLTC